MKPFRVGIQTSNATAATDWRALAREIEDRGFHVLSVADHLDDQFATTPAIMAAANATTDMKLASVVYCNDYHHPVVLAKEAATLDLLSDGRLEFGLGAGWMTTDYEASGILLDRPGIRIDRLAEALTIVKQLWSDGPTTFHGEHYRITALDGRPKPRQRPHPPIFVGGGGRRMLTVAATHADIIGLNIDLRSGRIDESSGPTATAEATDRKLEWIRAAAGDRIDDLEIQTRIHVAAITDDRASLAAEVAPAFGMTTDEYLECPHSLAGSVTEIVEQCLERRERWGISYITLSLDAMAEFTPVVAALRDL
jgi:probable F420-dependent oxidoreductase